MTRLKLVAGLSVVVVCTVMGIKMTQNNKKTEVTDRELAQTTAMITNLKGNSGGTGVVLQSSDTESLVLTNAHVCEVVKAGGVVKTDNKRAVVSGFKVSKIHDLCLISVKNNLGINTEVASSAPDIYSSAAVAGHPALLPTIVTRGHFGDHEVITIVVGIRECKEEDLKSDLGMICLFLGGIPIIKNYEAQVVSSTIMPGSSGSAVFNSRGEIAGMVFAGTNMLSYAHIVPQEYVRYFLEEEAPMLEEQTPSMEIDLAKELKARNLLKEVCSEGKRNENYEKVKMYCNYLKLDLSIN